ncbi:hypothetical protein K0I73_12185 [Shewanella mesophila]|uniref:DUF6445 family protein n=1 Tax=Shewanella mesophila TaxID=2864208 RepID=UPI001C655BC5|nr:DUF6445 family protein [Shewanella mesophila]QYJ84987.1 hypothetical protein K0I73_12185 [Shewanella mesophila]
MAQEDQLINPSIHLTVKKVGREQTPIIIVDNFSNDTEQLINYAKYRCDFTTDDSSYYPGVRSALPKTYVNAVLNMLYQTIYDVYQIPPEFLLRPRNYCFSLISHQPEQLMMLQRMPHFDTLSPNYFAILHYLGPHSHGDTGLFRHRPTNWERIDQARSEHYFSAANAHIKQHGEPQAGYFVASDHHFELFDRIEYRPNRLVVYPGNLLHSVLIEPNKDIDSDPTTGRLTANIFVEFTNP